MPDGALNVQGSNATPAEAHAFIIGQVVAPLMHMGTQCMC